MKSCHIALLWGIIFLTLTGVQAFLISKTGRCSCIKVMKGKILGKNIQKLVWLPPSPFCSHDEFIATMKNGEKICLDPDSPRIKFLEKSLEKMIDKKKKSKTGNKRQVKKSKKFKKAYLPPPGKTT
ncbi:C-X-C motif chemokine 9 [Sarcophilus harrisii]|uniref:C-X-C motif chemokine ligand 9 n=1 Tax=Sarcophilus harrisii TaxID=9305 RepID=G3VMQ7_SARHA|nr:C-X-C motif chemokine 9 [Sarcophilus harrisii]